MIPSDQELFETLLKRLKSIESHSEDLNSSERVALCFKNFTVQCAKLPLISESEYFEAAFTNKNFSDSGKEAFVLKCEEEFTMFAFIKVLEFIFDKFDSRSNSLRGYRNRKLEMDLKLENFQSVLELSNYLQVKEIDKVCTQFIIDNLEVDNAKDVFEMALRLNMDKLIEATSLFVGYHLIDLINELDLAETSVEFLKMVLSQDTAKVDAESILLDFLWSWVKSDLEKRKHLLEELLPLIRLDFVTDKKKSKFRKKMEKKLNQKDILSCLNILGGDKPSLISSRSWPQMLVLCDSLTPPDSDLQELSFSEIKEVLSQMILVKDLEQSDNSGWEMLDPPKFGLKLDKFIEVCFAGGGDALFLVIKEEVDDEEIDQEFELVIWMNVLSGKMPEWLRLSHPLPRDMHQISYIRAKLCWNILFITGHDEVGDSVGYYLDLSSYEPEWRQWEPLQNLTTRHKVAELCGATGSKDTLWVVTPKRRLCPCPLCVVGREVLEVEKVFPSGKTIAIRLVAGPEDVRQPRVVPYKDTVMVVGGQDPNTCKCQLYDTDTGEWVEAASLHEGRSEAGVVSVGSVVFAVGGRGFFWDERINSVEKLNWEHEGQGWSKEARTIVNTRGSLNLMVINKPLSWIIGRRKQELVDYCF